MAKVSLMVFKNQYKKEDKQPDYKVNMHHDKLGFINVGAGWIKETKTKDKYISLSIETEPQPTLTEQEKATIAQLKEIEQKHKDEVAKINENEFNSF